MYAVIQESGRQFRVQQGDRILIDYREAQVGQTLELDKVLLCSQDDHARVGTPLVEGAVVLAEVLEQEKGPKVKIQKFRRRKGYRRLTGHRQLYTAVKIREIRVPELAAASAE